MISVLDMVYKYNQPQRRGLEEEKTREHVLALLVRYTISYYISSYMCMEYTLLFVIQLARTERISDFCTKHGLSLHPLESENVVPCLMYRYGYASIVISQMLLKVYIHHVCYSIS